MGNYGGQIAVWLGTWRPRIVQVGVEGDPSQDVRMGRDFNFRSISFSLRNDFPDLSENDLVLFTGLQSLRESKGENSHKQ